MALSQEQLKELREEFNTIIPEFVQQQTFMMNSTRLAQVSEFYQRIRDIFIDNGYSATDDLLALSKDVLLSFRYAGYERLKDVYIDLGLPIDGSGYVAEDVEKQFPKGW